MPAVTRNLFIEQGATFILPFRWCYVEEVNGVPEVGAPRDLTGWEFRMQVRKSQTDPPLVDASSDPENGRIILGKNPDSPDDPPDPTNGWVWIELSDEDTDLMTSKSALYDLEAENPQGQVFRLLKGKVTVDPNITQEGGDEPPVEG